MARDIKLPEYENPPVIEVACGIRFQPLQNFRVGHFGLFWTQVRDEFSRCENASPIGPGPEAIDLQAGVLMPRAWLINVDDDRLLQVQHNRFLFNWRRRKDEAPYPRYEAIIRSFWDRFEQFARFCVEEDVGDIEPVEMELTYINHIPCGQEPPSAQQVAAIVPDVAWDGDRHAFLPPPVAMAWRADFELPDGAGRLSAKLNPAFRAVDKSHIIVLELSARGSCEADRKAQQAWFDLAHHWIVAGFADLTDRSTQERLWGRHD